MTNEEVYRVFLKNRRKYSPFKRQLVYDNISINSTVSSCVYNGFHIERSKEGEGYWVNVHEEWVELCKKFNIYGPINLTKV